MWEWFSTSRWKARWKASPDQGTARCIFRAFARTPPVRLRLCQPGEQGSVISNYISFGENQPFEWNIAPLSIYLYGVEDPKDRPLFASPKIKSVLEERYREKFLSDYCSDSSLRHEQECGMAGDGGRDADPGHLHLRGKNHGAAGPRPDQGIQFGSEHKSFQWLQAELRQLYQASDEYILSPFHPVPNMSLISA